MSALRESGDRNIRDLADGIRDLIGRPLAAVEFVQDYVQLHFDGPTLTAYTLPSIRSASSATLVCGEVGWRDALCDLIGSVVRRTEVRPERMSLEFEDGAVVGVSLSEEDYREPEALQFSLDADHTWVV